MVQNINSSQLNRRLFPLTSATHPFYGSKYALFIHQLLMTWTTGLPKCQQDTKHLN